MELGDNVDLDYFDRQDLGRLRRKIRNAVQGYRRERELYLEIVTQYFQVRSAGVRTSCRRQRLQCSMLPMVDGHALVRAALVQVLMRRGRCLCW